METMTTLLTQPAKPFLGLDKVASSALNQMRKMTPFTSAAEGKKDTTPFKG